MIWLFELFAIWLRVFKKASARGYGPSITPDPWNWIYRSKFQSSQPKMPYGIRRAYREQGVPGRRPRGAPRRYYPGRVTFSTARAIPTGRRNYPAMRATVPVVQPRAEIKAAFITPVSVVFPNLVAYNSLVTVIPEGQATDGDRDGNVIKVLDMYWRMRILKPAGADPDFTARVIFYRWTQGYVNPSAASILDNPGPAIISPYNTKNARNYKILYDQEHKVVSSAGVAGAYSSATTYTHGHIKLGFNITFQSSSGTTGDNAVWVLVLPSNTGSSLVDIATDVHFIDM